LPLIAGRAPRALVVDPSPSVRSQVAVALRQIGVDAEGVGTLAQAEDVLSMRSYELMILEPRQPDGDGIDMLTRFRNESTLSLPIIVLSARSGLRDLARAAWVGCSGYLGKPVALSVLHGTVSRVLLRSLKPRLDAERRALGASDDPLTLTGALGGPVTQWRRALLEGLGGSRPATSAHRLPSGTSLAAPAGSASAASGGVAGGGAGGGGGAAGASDATGRLQATDVAEVAEASDARPAPTIESALDALSDRDARTPGPVRSLRDLFRP